MELKKLTRVFAYAGMELPDPDSSQSPGQAAQAFSALYPELNNCDVQGPEVRGDKLVYQMVRAVGRKGASQKESSDSSHDVPKKDLSPELVLGQVDRFFRPGAILAGSVVENRDVEESPVDLPPTAIL